jgi:hypothetical protein
VWEFNWGIFWAVLAALTIYTVAPKVWKRLGWDGLGIVVCGTGYLATVIFLVAFFIVLIAVIFFPHSHFLEVVRNFLHIHK